MVVSDYGVASSVVPSGPMLITLTAKDLVGLPEYRTLWFPGQGDDVGPPGDLPEGRYASPMGYWFYPTDDDSIVPDAVFLTVRERRVPETPMVQASRGCRARKVVTLRSPHPEAGPLTLAIGGTSSAEVIASPAAWSEYSEAVLLAVTQYARLHAIEKSLGEVYTLFRSQESASAVPSLWRWLRQGAILMGADTFGETVYDWGHFTGPQLDPAHYMRSSRSIGAYRYLADGIGIPGWCQRLEKMIDEIDSGYESMLDKLFHYKLFALGMGVELCILGVVGALLLL